MKHAQEIMVKRVVPTSVQVCIYPYDGSMYAVEIHPDSECVTADVQQVVDEYMHLYPDTTIYYVDVVEEAHYSKRVNVSLDLFPSEPIV